MHELERSTYIFSLNILPPRTNILFPPVHLTVPAVMSSESGPSRLVTLTNSNSNNDNSVDGQNPPASLSLTGRPSVNDNEKLTLSVTSVDNFESSEDQRPSLTPWIDDLPMTEYASMEQRYLLLSRVV
jgi:hypothetical protein